MSGNALPERAGPARRWSGLAALHAAVALFGVAGLFGKWVSASPLLIVFGRVAVASLTFALLLRWWRIERLPAPAGERAVLAGCGALLAFHWFAFFHAIQLSTVAVGLLAYSTAPVFVVLLEPPWFGERWSARTLAAALLCMAGVALIVPHWEPGAAVFRGTAWGVAAGLSFAVLSMLNRGLVQRHHSIHVALYQDATATVLLAPLVPLVWRPLGVGEVALLVLLGVFCTALAHTLFIQSLRHVRASVAAIASAMEPVYGIALAVAFLGEVPTLRTVAGGALVVAAVLAASVRSEPAA